MKANELMIGDWALINGTPRKIQAVDGVDDEIMADDELYTLAEDRYHSEDRVEGVPLTPEILEKNGFKLRKDCTSAWNWEKGNCSVQVTGLPETFMPQTLTIYTPARNMAYGAGFQRTLSDLPINGVHELQHALRLCGIEKEIEL